MYLSTKTYSSDVSVHPVGLYVAVHVKNNITRAYHDSVAFSAEAIGCALLFRERVE